MKANNIIGITVIFDNDASLAKNLSVDVLNVKNTKLSNLGYGGGINKRIREAIDKGYEWFIAMNQDLKVTKSGMEKFQKILEKSPPGIVGPFAGGLDPKRWTTILPSKNVDYISGACMAIHRDVIEKIGFFYEPYFMYYEDADYSLRAKKAGFPLIHVPVAGIAHDDTPMLGKGSFLHEYYLARNHLLFVERQAPPAVRLYEYLRLPKTMAEGLRGNRGAGAGVADYLLHRFGEKKL